MVFGSPTFRRFMGYARRYWLIITGSIVSGVLKFGLALLLPIFLGQVLDNVILAEVPDEVRLGRLWTVTGVLAVAFLFRIPVAYLRTYWAELAGNRTIFDIRQDLYRHIQRLSMSFHNTQRTGATTSRIVNDINAAQSILDRGVMSVGVDFLFLCGTIVLLLIWDWKLALVSLFTLPLYAMVFGLLNPKLRARSKVVAQQMSELSGEVNEKLSGHSVVMAFARERSERLRFHRYHRAYFERVMDRMRVQVWLIALGELFTLVGPMIVICYGTYRVLGDTLEPGDFVAFYGILSNLYLPMRRLADASAAVQMQLASMDRVFELMDVVPEIADTPGARKLDLAEARVDFEHVSFGYREGTPIIRDLSFTAETGQSVAIVGRSGAGKSTLVQLLPRFYDVDGGAILVDGQDIRELTQHSLREHIGMVMQDPILFNLPVRENIAYGRRNATEEEMMAAAHMAHVDEFVSELPEGYNTVIGERGVTLSGGQKQRVSIARAFLRDPAILILDEATSNLDSHAEAIIQDALAKLMRGRTTLVIAHRLSTIIDCDKVMVMDEGRIVQEGTHDELLQQPGPYRALCEEQFGSVQMEDLVP